MIGAEPVESDTANIKIITAHGGEMDVTTRTGANLLDVLRVNEVSIAANCGGRGTCG
jgi:ferredoxin